MRVLLARKWFSEEAQDEIALIQLRRTLLIANEIHCTEAELTMVCQEEEMRLSQVNANLILQPGTQIFLADIDQAAFQQRNGLIYLSYQRRGKTYERVLINA